MLIYDLMEEVEFYLSTVMDRLPSLFERQDEATRNALQLIYITCKKLTDVACMLPPHRIMGNDDDHVRRLFELSCALHDLYVSIENAWETLMQRTNRRNPNAVLLATYNALQVTEALCEWADSFQAFALAYCDAPAAATGNQSAGEERWSEGHAAHMHPSRREDLVRRDGEVRAEGVRKRERSPRPTMRWLIIETWADASVGR